MELGSGIRDPGSEIRDSGSEIRDPGSGKNLFRIPDPGPGVKKTPDPGSGSATLAKPILAPPPAKMLCLTPVPRQFKHRSYRQLCDTNQTICEKDN